MRRADDLTPEILAKLGPDTLPVQATWSRVIDGAHFEVRASKTISRNSVVFLVWRGEACLAEAWVRREWAAPLVAVMLLDYAEQFWSRLVAPSPPHVLDPHPATPTGGRRATRKPGAAAGLTVQRRGERRIGEVSYRLRQRDAHMAYLAVRKAWDSPTLGRTVLHMGTALLAAACRARAEGGTA